MKLLGRKIYRTAKKPYKNGWGSIGNRGRGAEAYNPSGCCVHPDTRISMADGTTKAAKDIRIGDELMTQAGKGKVEIISNPELGYRSLYSYGRGSYFITGDHPIHADGEWKSLLPGFSKIDYGVECKRLEKGSVLTLINGDKVKLERIEGKTDNPNLVLYDFHMDGDEDANHTYFANGLLVHNGGGGGGGGGGCGYDSRYGESRGNTWSTDHSTAQSSAGGAETTDTTIAAEDVTSGGLVGDAATIEEQQQLADSIDDTTIDDDTGEYQTFAAGGADGAGGEPQDEAETTPGTDQSPEAQEDKVTGETPTTQTETFQEKLEISEDLSPEDKPMGTGIAEGIQQGLDADSVSPEDRPTGQGIMEGVQEYQSMDPLDQKIHQQKQEERQKQKTDFDPTYDKVMKDPVDLTGTTMEDITQKGEEYKKEQDRLKAERDKFDKESQKSQQDFLDKVEEQRQKDEQAFNQREDVQYSDQLKEMWDDPDQRGDLTGNEVQRLKNEGYIRDDGTGQATEIAHGGGTALVPKVDDSLMGDNIGVPAAGYVATDTSDVDTKTKLQAGAELSQIDYQNIANMKEEDRIDIQKQLNPNQTLEGTLDFANLTGTSPVNYMTQQNLIEMSRTGQGYADLSMDDQRDIVRNNILPDMSLEAISQLPAKDKDNYWTLKTEQVGGVPKPDPYEDPQGYRNFINMKNEVLDQAMKNDPEFMNARIEAKTAWAAKKGLNFGKGKVRQLVHGMISGKTAALAGTILGGLAGGALGASAGGLAGRYLGSKVLQAALKSPKKEVHQAANQYMNNLGLTVEQAGAMGDAMNDWEASDEGQSFIDNYVANNPEYQATIDENWNKQNGVVYDPNALDGQGATTAIYGYTDDGIPMTREEALNERGYDWVESRDKDTGYGQASLTTTTGDTITSTPEDPDNLGVLFDEMPRDELDPSKEPITLDEINNMTHRPAVDLKDEDPKDDTKPGEGDTDMKPPSGGAPSERWERFMEMMEKRASGEAPSLSEEAMRREREEGLKERMAVMAMGRGQPTAAGLRQYDRAKGAADAELARDASIARLKEQQLAQQQYGDALSAQLDREQRERTSKYGTDANLKMKKMDIDNIKDGAERKAWWKLAEGTWKVFGNDIEEWIRDGWSESAAKKAIESQGGGGGEGGDPTPPSGTYDHYTYSSISGSKDDGPPSGSTPPGTEWVFEGDQWTGVGNWTLYPSDDYGSGWHDGGAIDGPGTETSDDIPALLSDGEFVINARTVRGLGRSQGANNKKEERKRGVQFLEQLQKEFGEEDEISFGDVIAARRGL